MPTSPSQSPPNSRTIHHPPRTSRSRARFPWHIWLDGREHIIRTFAEDDYNRSTAYAAGRRLGLYVYTRRTPRGLLIRAFARSTPIEELARIRQCFADGLPHGIPSITRRAKLPARVVREYLTRLNGFVKRWVASGRNGAGCWMWDFNPLVATISQGTSK